MQGPPGTGKTKVLSGIVANMIMQHPNEQILVATSMNFTADLVAEALFSLDTVRSKVCRVYSDTREDIFNVNIKELPEWSILNKMLFDTEKLNDYTLALTTYNQDQLEQMTQEEHEQAAKFQVEYYFGNTNYSKDWYLRNTLEGADGWISLRVIYDFPSMRKFHNYVPI